MYAVFEDGSRQYRVQEGDRVKIDFREAEIGASVAFERVLLTAHEGSATIGQPLVAGAKITGEIVEHPTIKLYIQKFRKRKNYPPPDRPSPAVHAGPHRQDQRLKKR